MNDEMLNLFERFKNRELKAKDIFEIKEVEKSIAYDFVREYHYLADAKFFAKFSYGMYCMGELVGVATYSNPQGGVAMKGWFSLPNSDQTILELSRLCMYPQLNGTNATSFLLGNSIKMLKQHKIRAVITLADASRHIGSIYQVCNFKYYGLSNPKMDFFWYPSGQKNPRKEGLWDGGNLEGVWLPRSRKHRYAFILDKHLKCNYKEMPHPTTKGVTIVKECCGDKHYVYDKRMKQYYTCPYCTGKLLRLTKEQIDRNDDIMEFVKESSTPPMPKLEELTQMEFAFMQA